MTYSKRERVAVHVVNLAVVAIIVGLVNATWAAVFGAWIAYFVGFCVGSNPMMMKRQP